jgi:hypothetical protein
MKRLLDKQKGEREMGNEENGSAKITESSTADEARAALRKTTIHELASCIAVGIFECRLMRGHSVLESYEHTVKETGKLQKGEREKQ